MTNLKVLRNDVEWETRFDGNISSIEVNGEKLNDIHELGLKIEIISKRIRVLLYACLSIAIVCFGLAFGLCTWLAYNNALIQEALTFTKH